MSELQLFIAQIIAAAALGKKVVVRRRGNKISLANAPTINKNRVPTLNQQEHQNRFSAATAYASAAMSNPELEKPYRKRATAEKSKFQIAVRDYMRGPEVKKIDATMYNGSIGSIIRIKAIDDFAVKEVRVSIYNVSGDLIEESNALIDPINRLQWVFIATRTINVLTGCKIKAIAQDLPGNRGELEINL